ncbi:MAG: hypothetical protein HY072_01595 [Deltaproteobacteria bacterium]|nr:hypothetical protein [Deltaproteobacteria bacterium]
MSAVDSDTWNGYKYKIAEKPTQADDKALESWMYYVLKDDANYDSSNYYADDKKEHIVPMCLNENHYIETRTKAKLYCSLYGEYTYDSKYGGLAHIHAWEPGNRCFLVEPPKCKVP